jgi:transcriptional regulator with XRE-family HTH domain
MARKQTPICEFRDRLRSERKRRGWSQEQLCERLAQQRTPISQSVISKMESAHREPRPDELVAIAKVFGLTVDTMLGYKGGKDESLDYALRSMRDTARRSATAIRMAASDIDAAEGEVYSWVFAGNRQLAHYLSAFHRHTELALTALRIADLLTDFDVAAPPGFTVNRDEVSREQIRAECDEARERLRRARGHLDALVKAAPNSADVLTTVFKTLTDRLFPADSGQLADDADMARVLSEFVLPKAGL